MLGIVGVAWASRSGGGGAQNVLLPAFATLAILFGFGLHEALRQFAGASVRARTFQGYLLGLGVLQLALLAYDPRPIVPYRADRVADGQLAAAIAVFPGLFLHPISAAIRPARRASNHSRVQSTSSSAGLVAA